MFGILKTKCRWGTFLSTSVQSHSLSPCQSHTRILGNYLRNRNDSVPKTCAVISLFEVGYDTLVQYLATQSIGKNPLDTITRSNNDASLLQGQKNQDTLVFPLLSYSPCVEQLSGIRIWCFITNTLHRSYNNRCTSLSKNLLRYTGHSISYVDGNDTGKIVYRSGRRWEGLNKLCANENK